MSIPPTWFPVIWPPVLAQLTPRTLDRCVISAVVVVMTIELLIVFDPTVFPSPVSVPPIVIPDPLVSIPMKTLEAVTALLGIQDIDNPAIVFPLIEEAGVELLVVN